MMMFRNRDDLMLTRRPRMGRNLLPAIMHFELVLAITDPNRRAGICPRYRVPVAFPGHVRIASHLAQLFVAVRVWQSAADRLKLNFLLTPSIIDSFMRCAVDTLVANFPDPLPQLSVEVIKAGGFATLQTTQEVSAYVL